MIDGVFTLNQKYHSLMIFSSSSPWASFLNRAFGLLSRTSESVKGLQEIILLFTIVIHVWTRGVHLIQGLQHVMVAPKQSNTAYIFQLYIIISLL